MEKLNIGGETLTCEEPELSAEVISAIIGEIEKLDEKIDLLQLGVKVPQNRKAEFANALCQLASECAAIAANLIAG